MYILLKFMSEKNYLKDFLDGHLYMNSLLLFLESVHIGFS